MSRVSLKGVIIGGITDLVFTMLLGVFLVFYIAAQLDVADPTEDQIMAAIRANALFYTLQVAIGAAGSIFGGYVAAWLAKRNELLNGALSAILCIAMGVYSISAGHASGALAETAVSFVMSPLLGLLGGYIRFIQRNRRRSQP